MFHSLLQPFTRVVVGAVAATFLLSAVGAEAQSKRRRRIQVHIESLPSGATVYLDNVQLGVTPLRDVSLPRGPLTLIFELDNHLREPLSVRVTRPGEVFRAHLFPKTIKGGAAEPQLRPGNPNDILGPRRRTLLEPETPEPEDEELGEGLSYQVNGHYRVRAVTLHGIPEPDPDDPGVDGKDSANFAFMRLRLQPSVTYRPKDEDWYVWAALQVDLLDHVVLGGDRDVLGADVEPLSVREAYVGIGTDWGRLQAGRMNLFDAGGGPNIFSGTFPTTDWGDPFSQPIADQLRLTVEPLKLLDREDDRTSLLAIATYAPLVSSDGPETEPFRYVGTNSDDGHLTFGYVGLFRQLDPERDTDQIGVGAYYFASWFPQLDTDTLVLGSTIDFGYGLLRATLNAERETGNSDFSFGPAGSLTEVEGLSVVTMVGAQDDNWSALMYSGFHTGDADPTDGRLTTRWYDPNYFVGLLLYQVALNARSANQWSDEENLWSLGRAYNSLYLNPHVRYRVAPQVEWVGAFLIAWANELAPELSARDDGTNTCGLAQSDCLLGWEVDMGLHMRFGPEDNVRWSTEAGVLSAGQALSGRLSGDWLWTVQSRVALVW